MRQSDLSPIHHRARGGFTLLELLVVTLILAILTTTAVVTVTGLTVRARIAATFGTIRAMEIAANRYEIDFGEFPPGSTGTAISPFDLNPLNPAMGNGYFLLSILHTLSGNALQPLDDRFPGPLMDVNARQIGDIQDLDEAWGNVPGFPNIVGSGNAATQQLLDAFGNPFRYIRAVEYETFLGTRYPFNSPFAATETFFNPTTFQIVSLGPDGTTDGPPDVGLGPDDITNLGNAGLP